MKKNINYIFLILLSLLIIPNKVKAIPVSVSLDGGFYSIAQYRPEGQGEWKDQHESKKWIHLNGKKYISFCVDPGSHLSRNTKYDCSPTSDQGLIYIMNGYLSEGIGSYDKYQLAFRMYAALTGVGNGNLTNMRGAIIRYNQIGINRTNIMSAGCPSCPTNRESYLRGDIVAPAFDLSINAWKAKSGSLISGSGGLTFTKTSSSKEQITYSVKSGSELVNVQFKCNNKCRMISQSWAGKNGTVTISPADPNKCDEFEIQAFYEGTGVHLCTPQNAALAGTYQFLVTSLDAAEGAGEAPGGPLVAGTPGEPSGEPTEIYRDVPDQCDNPDCCIEPLGEPEPQIFNCCEDGKVSTVDEPILDKLVCKYEGEIVVDYYKKRCGADKYKDNENELNEFCELLCTERVKVEIPKSITAKSGRYFQLTATSGGYKSPYVEGTKRCRMRIHYNEWHKEYENTVRSQVTKYNLLQKNKAYYHIYKEAYDNRETVPPHEFKASCTITYEPNSVTCCTKFIYKGVTDPVEIDKCDKGLKVCEKECQDTETKNAPAPQYPTIYGATNGNNYSSTKSYELFYFSEPLSHYPYHLSIDIDENKHEQHSILTFKYKGKIDTKLNHLISVWDIEEEIRKVERFVTENKKVHKGTEVSCTDKISGSVKRAQAAYNVDCQRNDKTKAETLGAVHENVKETMGDYLKEARNYNAESNSLANHANELEEKIDECDNYFDEKGKSGVENYDFSPNLSTLTYGQVYVSEFGEKKLENRVIPFVPGNGEIPCVITDAEKGGEDPINGMHNPQYDKKEYLDAPKLEEVHNIEFKAVPPDDTGIKWHRDESEIDGDIEEKHIVDKKFVQDAKYEAKCFWKEPDENYIYTLAPTGEAGYTTFNYTVNENMYQLYLTTLEGSYELRWDLRGIGSKLPNGSGKFDGYFAESGKNTCGGEDPGQVALLTCKIKVLRSIMFIGTCRDEPATISPENCDPLKPTELPLNFKVVDPSDIFPTGTSHDGKTFAKNWTSETRGQNAKDEIEAKGRADSTYSPANVSYSFKLDPETMRRIKNYNASRENNNEGGYGDFSLYCVSDDNPSPCHTRDDETCYRETSVTNCRSVFLRNNTIIDTTNKNNIENAHSSPRVHIVTS